MKRLRLSDLGGRARAAAEAVLTATAPAKRANKYNAKRSEWQGRMYDSKAERDRRIHLANLEMAGEVSEIKEQDCVELLDGLKYKADFSYMEAGRRVYEDVKGVMQERFRVICKVWAHFGPGPLRIVVRKGAGWSIRRTIYPRGGAAPT